MPQIAQQQRSRDIILWRWRTLNTIQWLSVSAAAFSLSNRWRNVVDVYEYIVVEINCKHTTTDLYILWVQIGAHNTFDSINSELPVSSIQDTDSAMCTNLNPLKCTGNYTQCLKNCAKLFLPELRQISTNFDIFWQKDTKEAKIMRGALIFCLI